MVKGSVLIDVDRCKGCALCTQVCPQNVLQMSRNHFNARGYRPVVLVDPDQRCTGCALCALMCPDVALTVYRAESRRPHSERSEPEAPAARAPQLAGTPQPA